MSIFNVLNMTGSVRFVDSPCVEKSVELLKVSTTKCQIVKSVNDKVSNDDVLKNFSYFDTFSFSYTVKKRQMCNVSNDEMSKRPQGPAGLGSGKEVG